MVLIAVKMPLKMRACHCVNEKGIADDVVNVGPVLVDAAFDKIVGDCQMGGEHKLGEGE
jgi:hypothetical protein